MKSALPFQGEIVNGADPEGPFAGGDTVTTACADTVARVGLKLE